MQKINIYQARELLDNGQSIIITSGNDIIEVNKKQLFFSGKQQKLNRNTITLLFSVWCGLDTQKWEYWTDIDPEDYHNKPAELLTEKEWEQVAKKHGVDNTEIIKLSNTAMLNTQTWELVEL